MRRVRQASGGPAVKRITLELTEGEARALWEFAAEGQIREVEREHNAEPPKYHPQTYKAGCRALQKLGEVIRTRSKRSGVSARR